MNLPHIYLASRSPRRRQILEMVGINFTPLDIEIDEEKHFAENPGEYVLNLSEKKAIEASVKIKSGIIAAADTIVYVVEDPSTAKRDPFGTRGKGQILNKPKDLDDAKRMLALLSGRTHQVYTGFTLLKMPEKKSFRDFGVTDVTFRKLDEQEIEEYVQSGAAFDKAGSYGIQDDLSALFVERINGDFYNVVGLPLPKFYLTLKKFSSDNP